MKGLYQVTFAKEYQSLRKASGIQRTNPFNTEALGSRPSRISISLRISILLHHSTLTTTELTMADIRTQVEAGQERWGRGIDVQSDKTTTTDIDDFIKFKALEYEDADLKDDDMWEVYKDDFKDFTVEIFRNCNQILIRKLRTILRTNGVWVQKHRDTTVPKSLFNTI